MKNDKNEVSFLIIKLIVITKKAFLILKLYIYCLIL